MSHKLLTYYSKKIYIKFCIYLFAASGLSSLLTIVMNPITPSNPYGNTNQITLSFILGFLICLPILFVDYIILAKYKTSQNEIIYNEKNTRDWIHSNLNSLRETYENQFIAVMNDEVINSDIKLSDLKQKLREQDINLNKIIIEFINPAEVTKQYDSFKKESKIF